MVWVSEDHRQPNDGAENRMRDLLKIRRGLGASDSRNMLYAHVEFAVDEKEVPVDYTISCTEEYLNFACQQINIDRILACYR
jgi:hypothetical protein